MKKTVYFAVLGLLTILMFSFAIGTMEKAKADNQNSDSNSDPNTWSMFRNSLSHAGNAASTAPTVSHLLWSYTTGGVVESSPAVSNGIIYIGSNDGKVYALSVAKGTLIWSCSTGNLMSSSPAVANGVVYIGRVGADLSNQGALFAINASTGSIIWSFPTDDAVSSSPSVVNGVVYVGSEEGKVFALNATTGVSKWSFTAGDEITSSPAISNGIVYIGSLDNKLYALNANSGALVWSYITGNGVASSPAVDSGIVYVGSLDDKVYALNASTGALIWSYTTSGGVASSPAVVGGVVYIGSENDKVYALNAATGGLIWSYTTGGMATSSPAFSNGVVYTASLDGKIYALNATSGALIWSYITGAMIESSPAIAGGELFIASDDDKVYAFEQPLVAPSGASASKNLVDRGQTSVFSIVTNASGGVAPYSYQWLSKAPGDSSYSAINGATTQSYIWSSVGVALGSWSFELQITDNASQTVISNVLSVTVNSNPTVSLTSSSTISDIGHTITITANPSGGTGTYLFYQWYVNGSTQSGITAATFSFSSQSLGSYLITATVTDSLNATSAPSSGVFVSVNSALAAPTVTSAPSIINQAQASSLTSSTVFSGTSPYTYQWFIEKSDASYYSLINGAASSSYNYVSSSLGSWNFILQVTDNIGSSVNSTIAVVTVIAPTPSPTPTPSPSPTQTPTPSPTPSSTHTSTPSPTPTLTPEVSPTKTPSSNSTATPSPTIPEFSSVIIIPIALVAVAVVSVIYRRTLRK